MLRKNNIGNWPTSHAVVYGTLVPDYKHTEGTNSRYSLEP